MNADKTEDWLDVIRVDLCLSAAKKA